ncbi:MAG: peptidoglycan-binding protein [Alphaproteobacteria bacterium]|nr:peptidoglycan-binding protein [Alphaproteobacteria bacterium]MBM3651718.1 peptidoglycan-binding protein [Alphaproteobacteria bacterium]
MSKAKFPHEGRSASEPREGRRESDPRHQGRGEQDGDDDSIWRSIAALSKSRIEGQLGERPSANARPIRSALAELESQLARLSGEDRGAGFEKALSGLDRHLADIARRLNEDGAGRREAREESLAGDCAPAGREPDSGSTVEHLERAIGAVARSLDSLREDAAERGDQQLVMMRQIENIRREIRDMTQALGELAPRASVHAIETAIEDLCQRIDSQRERGVCDETLAPAERIIDELRPLIEALDPTPIVRNLRVDVETIGIRLEKLQTGNAANASAVRDLARDTHDIKEQLTALMARPLPLEKIETRIIDVTQRVDALTRSSGVSGADIGEVVEAIRAIVGAETGKGVESFNSRLDRLAQKLDALVEQSAPARFDEIGERIDALGETLTQRFDRGAAKLAPLEGLIASLAKKIDSALEGGGHASAFKEIVRRFDRLESHVTEHAPSESLARIEAMIAERSDNAAVAGDVAHFAALEDLLRGLDRKIDSALASDARQLDLQAVERELAQLSFKIDRFDDPFFAPRMSGQNSTLDEIAERLDRMQAAFAQRIEDGARADNRESELAALVESLADRINRDGSVVGAEALKSLETQIGSLAQRLERFDAGGASDHPRTNEALTAVQQTLERVVARLEMSGEEFSVSRGGAPEALRRPSVARECDVRGEAIGERSANAPETPGVQDQAQASADPLEFLLPAETSAADRREPFVAPPGSGLDQAGRRASVQSAFIAAARRAAQQHPADAEPAEAMRLAQGVEDQDRTRGGAVVKLSSAIQDRKRPLLLGLAAVMLAISAYQVARMGGEGGLSLAPALKQQEARAPAKAVRPTPSPEVALGPKRPPPPTIAAQPNIDPTPTGTIETPSPSSGDALAAIKRLAQQGDPAAQYDLGARLVEGRGAPRDAKAAAQWFEKAAERGLAPAQFRLGSLYEKGVGVDRDYGRARLWYERAADAGNARAMHNYAVLLAEGGDGKPDYAAAAEWFRRAAEYGVRDSQFNLAILYARGLGVSRNLQQSYAWFAAAAEQGDDDAARKRDEIGARLDSKELAAAKALAEAFRVKTPAPEANDAPALRPGGGEGARKQAPEQAPAKPTTGTPSGKPRAS